MSEKRPFTILCLASDFKGVPFIEEAQNLGCRVLLLGAEEFKDHTWPWDSINETFWMPQLHKQPDIIYAVSYLARTHKIDTIVALDDYDVATAATLREHLRLPGMGDSVARYFRDKLAMRTRAAAQGILVPLFTAVTNYDELREFMARVPTPWVLKPRFEAGAVGIRKLYEAEAVWRALDELGDQQSFYLLEQFLPGDVYHIDSIVWDSQPLFALASKYGAPPLSVTQGGGIFNTRTLDRDTDEVQALLAANRQLLQVMQHQHGVAHSEFIRSFADGRYYFLETAARVGGANIDKMVRAATGIELWAEAARVVVADLKGETYQLPQHREDYAALITCLAKQEFPDLGQFDAEEVVWRLQRPYHAGLLLASPNALRIEALLTEYNERFAHDFLHHQPGKKDVRTNI